MRCFSHGAKDIEAFKMVGDFPIRKKSIEIDEYGPYPYIDLCRLAKAARVSDDDLEVLYKFREIIDELYQRTFPSESTSGLSRTSMTTMPVVHTKFYDEAIRYLWSEVQEGRLDLNAIDSELPDSFDLPKCVWDKL